MIKQGILSFLIGAALVLVGVALAPKLVRAQTQTVITSSPLSGTSIEPIVSAAAEATHVIKNKPGVVYSVYATNLTSTAGFLLLLNAVSVPVDGAVTPVACAPLAANSAGGVASVNYLPGPGAWYSAGIVAVVSSGASCFTKTTGTITAFISGFAR